MGTFIPCIVFIFDSVIVFIWKKFSSNNYIILNSHYFINIELHKLRNIFKYGIYLHIYSLIVQNKQTRYFCSSFRIFMYSSSLTLKNLKKLKIFNNCWDKFDWTEMCCSYLNQASTSQRDTYILLWIFGYLVIQLFLLIV